MFRRGFFGQIQRAIGVKRDKDILVEAKYPAGYGVQAAVEIDRRGSRSPSDRLIIAKPQGKER